MQWSIFIISIIILQIYSVNVYAQGEWESIESINRPIRGGEYSLTSAENKLYLLGGRGNIPLS